MLNIVMLSGIVLSIDMLSNSIKQCCFISMTFCYV
jgi:hypothetical protein